MGLCYCVWNCCAKTSEEFFLSLWLERKMQTSVDTDGPDSTHALLQFWCRDPMSVCWAYKNKLSVNGAKYLKLPQRKYVALDTDDRRLRWPTAI